ncbi:MAG: ATP-binding protein [bacterium]|nr:ATP-binding protein [bacterium]
MPVEISIELLQVGLGLLVLGLLSGAWRSSRGREVPLGCWPLAWATLVASGGMRVAGVSVAQEYFATVVFWGFLLAGAYHYAGRAAPRWLLPGAAMACGAIALSLLLGNGLLTGSLVLVVSLGAAAQSAWMVRAAAARREATLLHRSLPLGFLLVALVGFLDHAVLDRQLESVALWLVCGILVATHQAMVVFDLIRRRADQIASELEASVSLLQATLEATGEGILVVDTGGHYRSFNRAFGEMWQIPQEVLDQRESEVALRHAMHQLKDPEEFYATVKRLYEDAEAESFDILEFEDGRVFERYSRPQRVGDEVVGRVWSFRNVTERTRAEEEAARHRDHLEEVVEERTRELIGSRDKLRQADRLAAIGTLAAGVAHQINNPIGAILNAAEYALLCEDQDDALAVFGDALRANADEARRCAGIVRGMLQFSRQEPVDKTVGDLNQAVRIAARSVESYARDEGARIDLELSEEQLPVRMSPLEIEQVVVNLMRNGIEACEKDAVVRVVTRSESGRAWIDVLDNGRGVRAEDRTRIFDPFFSTRLIEGGTGLGLSVAHGIVTDHGGRIAAFPGGDDGGTRFSVDLPLSEGDADDA